MAEQFISRAERIIDAILEHDPDTAQWAGDHRFDDRVPDYSADGVAAQVAMLREASHTLAEVDGDELATPDAVDLELLTNQVASRLFALTDLREHEWNPLTYNPGMRLNSLLLRPTDTAEVRLTALLAQLRALPDSLATARRTLRDMPEIHVQAAVGQFAGTAALVRSQVPVLAAEVPGMSSAASAATDQAVAALREFGEWLTTQPHDGEPRLGRAKWEAKLWHTLDTPLSARELLDRAWRRLDEVTTQIAEAGGELLGEPPSPEVAARALRTLAEQRPDDDTIVPLARRTMAEATEFVASHDLVTLLDDPLEIIEMPEFARGLAVAYCDPPGSLETAKVPTFYTISPTPADWDAARVESFYAEYNDHMLRNLTVHEAMPGHYLQLAHARRYRGYTRVRAVSFSGTFVEGWGVYAEELMASHGFGGLPVRMQQLKMQLRMVINALIDQLVHCEGMTEDEAMALMTERGFQSEGEAAGKWRRALLSSTQLSTYFVGHTEVAEIAAACPTGRPDRAWHDAMLAHGNPSPRHLRTLLGV
ncbi:uncharacterized protein (DUF885 family) [Stackebrandtia albiflava]|uniref:Uncharacterized protein (DUF885 family) n=1 Tax=Stackebrandtia albiflava TaxID=406432 RepID=A0A562V324_9ACTN|nr:DUF885 domain-containing protein [Stackebrandtia albiflava]TWJ12258.1 uncharacterized protein (DUF885 family) [Stackebrandtia albiflava]